ncbi:MAG: hypothetical protein NZ954_08290 [Thermofilaceae archaeon]|nr:hypothetical protein [Thermofilaceae archaeon]MDW8004908.1 hypothetical protein [Thermofilaceae archaeon]
MPRKLDAIGRCPRCNTPYLSTRVKSINGRDYLYLYHGKDMDGKPQYCYVGPVDAYVNVAAIKGAQFTNLDTEDTLEVVPLLESIVTRKRRRIDLSEHKSIEYRKLASELRYIAEQVEKLAREAETQAELYAKMEEGGETGW